MNTNKTSLENEKQPSCLGAVSGSFFKCKADDYSSYEKGKI